MEDWLLADWVGADGVGGAWREFVLSLAGDGRYSFASRPETGPVSVSGGTWAYDPAGEALRFRPDSGEGPRGSLTWFIRGRYPAGGTPTQMLVDCFWPPPPDGTRYQFTVRSRPLGTGLPAIPAPPPGRLTEWSDPDLGDLVWDERRTHWKGRLAAFGVEVSLVLWPGASSDPMAERQRQVIKMWHGFAARLRAGEADLRRRTAEWLTDVLKDWDVEHLPTREELANTLTLKSIGLTSEEGELHFYSPIIGYPITVLCQPDLSLGEMEIN